MKYTVIWAPEALDELTQLWIDSSDRQSVTDAANSVDRLLQRDPVLRGETHTRSTRIVIIGPLVVIYRVYDDDRMVKLLSIQPLPPRNGEQVDD